MLKICKNRDGYASLNVIGTHIADFVCYVAALNTFCLSAVEK